VSILPNAEAEFDGADLGDRRLDRRLGAIVTRVAASPSGSFPKLVPTVAEREALYRFVENDRVEWSAILDPHYCATGRRCRTNDVVRVAHDTTWFSFEGSRTGLGPISSSSRPKFGPRGFAGHFSLGISNDDRTAVLGVLALSPFVRSDTPVAHTKEIRKIKHLESALKPREEKESARWMDGVREAERHVGPEVRCIHVMDQEADNFAIFADLAEENRSFVIRGSAGRRIDRKGKKRVNEALAERTAYVFRTVPVTARKPSGRHTQRKERVAKLKIRGTAVVLAKPEHAQHTTKKVHLNVVNVFEPNPPQGEDAIEWTLYTTEPIKTTEDLCAVVDHYRARWRTEELFKALKTGCAFEKRQLATYEALLRALALLVPMAWHLLAIRNTARDAGEQPASDLVDDIQLDVLRALSPTSRIPSHRPTCRDVMRAIGDLGGHIRQNGDPGWLVLGRGYEDFVKAELVWRAALAHAEK